jgi:hypothetical protein
MKSIHTEIEIKAPASKVWEILMDFEKYPEWNPFIKSISGEAKVGGKLKVVMQQPDSKPMTFKPKCLTSEPNKEFKWLGHLLVKGIFDGEHIFKLREREDGTTKLVQCENFNGLLLPFFWKQLNSKTISAFEQMNAALKNRAEKS